MIWRRLVLFPLVALMAGCIKTVAYDPSPPSARSVARALEAERNLSHFQARMARETDPDHSLLAFCTLDGRRVEILEVRPVDGGVCGVEVLAQPTVSPARPEPERCWRFAEMASVGQPRDAQSIGYYPVRQLLRCPGP